jgi:CBS domain containing-hemolysin-like protein
MPGTNDIWNLIRPALPGFSWPSTLVWCVLFALLSGWYSGLETGVYRFNRLRAKLSVRSGHRAAVKIEEFFDDQRLLICILLIGTNLWNYLAASTLTAYFSRHGRTIHEAELYATLVVTLTFFIFAETIPKSWFYNRPNMLVLRSEKFIALSYRLAKVTGLGALLKWLSTLMLVLARLLGREGQMAGEGDDLGYLLRESHAAGALSLVQTSMAERVLGLSEERILRIMVPINRVVALPIEASREEFLRTVTEHPFACLPIYRDNPQSIIGVVGTDRLIANREGQPRELLEPVLELSAGLSMLSALNGMQHQPAKIAVVVDRHQHTIGIVTLADFVDYLLGQ